MPELFQFCYYRENSKFSLQDIHFKLFIGMLNILIVFLYTTKGPARPSMHTAFATTDF